MDAMRDVMATNIARSADTVGHESFAMDETPLRAPRPLPQRCRPISSGSSVDSAIALTGRPLARL